MRLVQQQRCEKVKNGEICNGDLREYMNTVKKRDIDGEQTKTKFLRFAKRGFQTFYSYGNRTNFSLIRTGSAITIKVCVISLSLC